MTGPQGSQAVSVMSCPTTFTCPVTCSVGYARGPDSCPTCQCVDAKEQPSANTAISCIGTFACSKSCDTGYKRGYDDCPVCDCVHKEECHECEPPHPTPKPDQTAVAAILHKCSHTEQCMTSCKNGYHMGSAGTDGCPACSCVEKETCHDCTESHHTLQIVQPVQVQTTSTDHWHECGTGGHQTQLVVTNQGGSGGVSSSGSSFESHASSGAIAGSGHFYGGAGGISAGLGGSGGGSECAPLPPDCHPSCIMYDVSHCRLCRCPLH